MTRLMAPTAPEAYPTVRIRATGLLDHGVMSHMDRKYKTASTSSTVPKAIKRQFRLKLASCD
ncbi:hypothetical protein [Bradyrhizobium sp. Cp5.3]|uniref:hypothetical protein n=1 Tax=Bradyrhizobium sp. Cp5.3 TaxID=443598 RepID=UPI0012EB72EE|nr:hypothetical protein [Bradyrhizobium sp. Cp5.3]